MQRRDFLAALGLATSGAILLPAELFIEPPSRAIPPAVQRYIDSWSPHPVSLTANIFRDNIEFVDGTFPGLWRCHITLSHLDEAEVHKAMEYLVTNTRFRFSYSLEDWTFEIDALVKEVTTANELTSVELVGIGPPVIKQDGGHE